MLLEGLYNQDHFIKMMLEKEYAFSLAYTDGHEVRVGHHKGNWTFAQFKNGELVRTFDIDDRPDMGYEFKIDALLRGYTTSRIEFHEKKVEDNFRELPAKVILDVVKLLVGEKNQVVRVDVKQPGRNAHIDQFTGEFSFSPREGEFKK
jgi:hypothetical protein